MRIAYLDCFAGISGDMFLGALVEAGVPAEVLQDAAKALDIGATLRFERVDRSGISCTKVHVMEGDRPAEHAPHSPADDAGGAVPVEQQASAKQPEAYTAQPKTQHLHKGGHPHSHEVPDSHTHEGSAGGAGTVIRAEHMHGRSLTQIRMLIERAALEAAVKRMALRAFELLGHAEAKIHNVPVEEIHFHEVGAVDAIVDIVAASAGICHLNVGAWYCSALNVGGGMVECAHGTFPVPAPATADLLRGLPTYSAHIQKELVTPTGAAMVRALEPIFGQQPPMRVERIGYGAGSRDPKGFPNVLRLQVGEALDAALVAPGAGLGRDRNGEAAQVGEKSSASAERGSELVAVIETALDDLSPQVIAYVAETALANGALDVMLTPVIMKKGRPGTLLTVLCDPAASAEMERLILRETSTLGVRIRQDRRACLERRHMAVQTAFGEIRMKVGSLEGEVLNAAPEFEDCRAAAKLHDVPLKQVQQAAIAAYAAAQRPA